VYRACSQWLWGPSWSCAKPVREPTPPPVEEPPVQKEPPVEPWRSNNTVGQLVKDSVGALAEVARVEEGTFVEVKFAGLVHLSEQLMKRLGSPVSQ
jgi:hypothetical protein